MAKWFVLIFICMGGVKVSAQCDSLKLDRLETILNVADILPTLTYIKVSFEKVGEDSLAYFYGRCPWESGGKCYPYKEYLVQSKSNVYYLRYQCYDLNTFTQIQKQIEAVQVIQEVQGKEYRTIQGNFMVNYMQSAIEENACGLTQQYMIEFLRFK
jgi:hypothetical protein